jgi:hypothetical protein
MLVDRMIAHFAGVSTRGASSALDIRCARGSGEDA